ncbi:hypothetical protein DES53_104126 [Roseimicrobium gellanilyticum]|uniref:Uncharacterized protein n=1 Tax=Roseimicrobium gellanilyticum TaxID=748857 RepID=A0A366HME3_9BACT|nr:hypothetical protein [Roseimicrobium gellanilyticum]RBP44307.1 hypothetical protein DES53_104126 [Roseimicrobium gellanilyticum]
MKSPFTIVILLSLIMAGYFAAIKIGPRFGFFMDKADEESAGQKLAPGERQFIAAHGCSLHLPDGWVQKPEQRNAVLFEFPRGAKDRGSMIIDSEAFDGTLKEFTDGHVKNMIHANPEMQIVSEGPFKTDGGIEAQKVTMRNRIGSVYLAQGMYFFEGPPGRKIKATYAASVAGDDLEPIFDACLKTLLLHSGPEASAGGGKAGVK